MPFQVPANTLTADIDGVPLMDAWIRTLNLHDFLFAPAQRGENAVVDGLAGEIAEQPVWAAGEVTLRVLIAGDVLHDNTTPPSIVAGQIGNITHLRDELVDPTVASRTLTLTLPGGLGTRTADVQVRGFRSGGVGAKIVRAELDVRVLTGVVA